MEKTPLDKAEFEAEDTRSVETFQPRRGESRLQIGVFNDGLAQLSREQAFAWCAERGIGRIEMGVGGWAQASHQLDLDALLREPAARDRLLGELREHGLELSCVNAAGNPLHPQPEIGARHAALVHGAIELAHALGVDRVVTMSGCPGSRDGGATPVFAPWALTPDDESLWEWQLEQRLAPFWRELCAWAAGAAPGVRICLELHPGASAYSSASFLRLAEHAGPNLGVNFDPSHFWWQGIDPLCVIEDVGDRIGFAHGKDTLVHADRVRRERPDRLPLPGRPRPGDVALRRRRRRPRHRRLGRAARRAARGRIRRRCLDRARGPAHRAPRRASRPRSLRCGPRSRWRKSRSGDGDDARRRPQIRCLAGYGLERPALDGAGVRGDPAAGAGGDRGARLPPERGGPVAQAALDAHARGRHPRRHEPVPRHGRAAGRAPRPPRRLRRARRRDRERPGHRVRAGAGARRPARRRRDLPGRHRGLDHPVGAARPRHPGRRRSRSRAPTRAWA